MVKGEAEKAEIDMLLEKLNASRADERPDNQGLLRMPDVEDH
jgi:hypothetical protein